MEALQKVVQWSSPPTSSPNQEAYGYAGGQGSPTPGETASPKSYFQQSPSLPASGLTEFSGAADSASWDPSPDQPLELLATRDVACTTSAPPKQYVGVRVKMPVRELLKKIRLSRGIDYNSSKEASVKTGAEETPGRTGKKRINSERRHKPKRHNSRIAMKGVEDLDILVEILEEDLNKSHSRLETRVSQSHLDGASSGFQLHGSEADGNQRLDGNQLGTSWDSTRFQQHCAFPGPGTPWHGCARHLNRSDDRTMQPRPSPITTHRWPHRDARSGQDHDPFLKSMGSFQGAAGQFGPPCPPLPGHVMSEPLGRHLTVSQEMGQSKANGGSLGRKDTLALSFFQFQLDQAESWLRGVPEERLLAPDTNGNRVLHKAVAQGKRALGYVLARRLALLNRIDEEDARKQTALHVAAQRNHHLIVSDLVSLGANINKRDGSEKTPLHLCAERGYPRVLEVFKNCQRGGTRVEVDATDNQGLTPLQCAAVAHSAIVMNLGKAGIGTEARTLLTLRKDQIWSGITCLLEMGADPWVQGTKSPSQASDYVAKVQGNSKLMSFLQQQRPKWQEAPCEVGGAERALSRTVLGRTTLTELWLAKGHPAAARKAEMYSNISRMAVNLPLCLLTSFQSKWVGNQTRFSQMEATGFHPSPWTNRNDPFLLTRRSRATSPLIRRRLSRFS